MVDFLVDDGVVFRLVGLEGVNGEFDMLIDLCFLIYLVINFLEVLFGLFLLLLVLVIVWGLCVGGVGIVEWLWFSGVI